MVAGTANNKMEWIVVKHDYVGEICKSNLTRELPNLWTALFSVHILIVQSLNNTNLFDAALLASAVDLSLS